MKIKVLYQRKNVIKFKEMLRTTNNMYMVYEFCNGGDLEDYLRKKKRLTETEASSFIK